jgi:hypothetical protein
VGWLPVGWTHPERADLPTGHHLRPIRAADVGIDHPAVMRSRERLWATYGEAWGWPPEDMTVEQDREDLLHHEEEIAAHLSFNYAVLDRDETVLAGCVYVDPAGDAEPDVEAVVSWWVADDFVGTELERALDEFVPGWLDRSWPFATVRFGV